MEITALPSSPSPLVCTNAALTVYYDGACPVCSREIAVYQRQVGAEQCVWIDASICAESAFGEGLSRGNALTRFHVRRADGVLVDGMRGFALLWQALPRFAWAGRIASIGPVPLLLDAAYRIFLWVRPLWQGARKATTSNKQP
jgi:predicted DCC family thiol-disulfide oxidoreductase YuxK